MGHYLKAEVPKKKPQKKPKNKVDDQFKLDTHVGANAALELNAPKTVDPRAWCR